MISGFIDHLWQSTLFAAAAWLLAVTLRKNRAHVRYWIWFAASVKFLVPFSLLVSLGTKLGSLVPWREAVPTAQAEWVIVWEQVSQPLTLPAARARAAVAADSVDYNDAAMAVFGLWALGFAVVAACWLVRWGRVRALRRSAVSLDIPHVFVPVMSAPGLIEPGVFGIFQPVLLLPRGICERLSAAQLEAILAHELCHVRRRDNLTAAIHTAVQATFWFHPLVWWLGSRLVDERERACDEEVLRLGSAPQVYAEGILNVCKQYVESPLVCMSGVSGSNLRKRIETIMKNQVAHPLNAFKKSALAIAGFATVALPVWMGTTSFSAHAQETGQAGLRFEVTSVKRSASQGAGGPGFRSKGGTGTAGSCGRVSQDIRSTMAARNAPTRRLCLENRTVLRLIYDAYEIQDCRQEECDLVSGGPDWIRSERFDVIAMAPSDSPTFTLAGYDQAPHVRQMLQALLADRFGLRLHREPREFRVYALTVAAGGFKLRQAGSPPDPDAPPIFQINGGSAVLPGGSGLLRTADGAMVAVGTNTSMPQLAALLSRAVDRHVIDRTGLDGRYDFNVRFASENAGIEATAPPIAAALEKDAGVKLEVTKAMLDVLVVDRAEQPSEN